MKFTQLNHAMIAQKFLDAVNDINTSGYFEDIAQQYCEALYKQHEESIVLTRIFITRPFETLPRDIKDFTTGLAETVGVLDQIGPDSPILSLAGTKGRLSDWSHRKTSGGHKGIPLVSSQFVSAVPMLMGLFEQAFGNLEWLDLADRTEMSKVTGKTVGQFYVEDAHTVEDRQGRKIIAAQDFVTSEGVHSVYGLCGGLLDGSMLVMLTFTRDHLPRNYLTSFLPALTALRPIAMQKIREDRVFVSA